MAKRKPTPAAQPELAFAPTLDDQDAGDALDEFMGGATFPGEPSADVDDVYEARTKSGRDAHRAGDAFEEAVAALLAIALNQRVVRHWHQVHVPTKHVHVLTMHRGWRWYREESGDAHADFAATEGAEPGRSIVLECKSTKARRLRRDAIEPQQRAHLEAGPIALLLVEFRTEGAATRSVRRYAIPWRQVPWAKVRKAESIDEAAVARWQIRTGNEFLERLRGR